MKIPFFKIEDRSTPVIATAIHDGHFIQDKLRPFMLLNEQERAREEDPYTAYMIAALPLTKIKVESSRFQLDLNRVKEKAIYEKPEDAWGLNVWKKIHAAEKEKLHRDYDLFYEAVKNLLDRTIDAHGHFVILDVHTYNHRREDPFAEADSDANPEINLGTAFNKPQWKELCDNYAAFLTSQEYDGQPFDARQNIKFKGGAFAQWVLKNYGDKGSVLSIEFKKTFMDEWTGIADIPHVNALANLLSKSAHFLENEVKKYL